MYRIFCNSEQNSYQWIVNLVVGNTSTKDFHPPKALSHYQTFWKCRPIYVLHGHQTYENISAHLLKLQGILRKWMQGLSEVSDSVKTGKCTLKKLTYKLVYLRKIIFFSLQLERTILLFLEKKKSSSSFSIPGIIFLPHRNI